MRIIKFLIVIILLIPASLKAQESFPDFPMSFYGQATFNNDPMPVGTKIQAYAGSSLKGQVTISEAGLYGYDNPTKIKLVVGDFTGNLTFKYVLVNSVPESGCSGQEYTSGFVSGNSILKNLSFNNTGCGAQLTDTQITPNIFGVATSSNITPQVVVTSPTQSVSIVVNSGTTNPTIDVSELINGGVGTLPAITITSVNANNASVDIPAATIVTSASTTWDGVIAAPTLTTVSIPETSGQTKTFSTAIEVGFTGAKLSFNKAIRLLLPGQASKRAGYVRTGITFTEITNICAVDNQAMGDTLAADGDCKIDVGSDLVIWTKHFTSFATYTQTTTFVPAPSSGGGGSGGESIIYCSSVTYSSWQPCIGNQQFRTVLTQIPNACILTTRQQLELSRVCQQASSTDSIVDSATSTDSVSDIISTTNSDLIKVIEKKVLGVKVADVIAEEKKLISKIDIKLSNRLSGNILLQVEKNGEAWYIYPNDKKKYYLGRPADAFSIMRNLGLGIKHSELAGYLNTKFPSRLSGKILLDVEKNGEAYYVNPKDLKGYFLNRPTDAFKIMREFGLGITNINIRKIDVGEID